MPTPPLITENNFLFDIEKIMIATQLLYLTKRLFLPLV